MLTRMTMSDLRRSLTTVLMITFLINKTCYSMPLDDHAHAELRKYKNENDGQDNYEYGYTTSNGIHVQETGTVKHTDKEVDDIVVTGSYNSEVPKPNDKIYFVQHGEDGYRQNDTITELPTTTGPIDLFRISGDALGTLIGGGMG